MTDDKKAREQALQAAAMELKAKGEQAPPQSTTPAQTPDPEPAEGNPSGPKESPKADPKRGKGVADSKKSAADALKELTRVRRNKIIGITAAVIAGLISGLLFKAKDRS
jgi:hypothetical protein